MWCFSSVSLFPRSLSSSLFKLYSSQFGLAQVYETYQWSSHYSLRSFWWNTESVYWVLLSGVCICFFSLLQPRFFWHFWSKLLKKSHYNASSCSLILHYIACKMSVAGRMNGFKESTLGNIPYLLLKSYEFLLCTLHKFNQKFKFFLYFNYTISHRKSYYKLFFVKYV